MEGLAATANLDVALVAGERRWTLGHLAVPVERTGSLEIAALLREDRTYRYGEVVDVSVTIANTSLEPHTSVNVRVESVRIVQWDAPVRVVGRLEPGCSSTVRFSGLVCAHVVGERVEQVRIATASSSCEQICEVPVRVAGAARIVAVGSRGPRAMLAIENCGDGVAADVGVTVVAGAGPVEREGSVVGAVGQRIELGAVGLRGRVVLTWDAPCVQAIVESGEQRIEVDVTTPKAPAPDVPQSPAAPAAAQAPPSDQSVWSYATLDVGRAGWAQWFPTDERVELGRYVLAARELLPLEVRDGAAGEAALLGVRGEVQALGASRRRNVEKTGRLVTSALDATSQRLETSVRALAAAIGEDAQALPLDVALISWIGASDDDGSVARLRRALLAAIGPQPDAERLDALAPQEVHEAAVALGTLVKP